MPYLWNIVKWIKMWYNILLIIWVLLWSFWSANFTFAVNRNGEMVLTLPIGCPGWTALGPTCQLKGQRQWFPGKYERKAKEKSGRARKAFCPTCPPFRAVSRNLRLTRALQKGQKGRTRAPRRSAQAQKGSTALQNIVVSQRSNLCRLGYQHQFVRRIAARRIAVEGTVAYQMTAEASKRLERCVVGCDNVHGFSWIFSTNQMWAEKFLDRQVALHPNQRFADNQEKTNKI